MFESLFRFLFKYPPLFFQQGDFVLGRLAADAAGDRRRRPASAATRCSPIAASRRAAARDRVVLVGLRLAIARRPRCSACSGPTLILKAAVPQQNFLGVLVDDSRSMPIADRDGQPRSAFVQQQLIGAERPLLERAVAAFVLRFFRFSSSADRVAVGRRPEVRRHGDAARRRRSIARATSWPACRSPAW